jgi:hypothetical protein
MRCGFRTRGRGPAAQRSHADLAWIVVALPPRDRPRPFRRPPGAARVEDRGSMRLLWSVIAASVAAAVGKRW